MLWQLWMLQRWHHLLVESVKKTLQMKCGGGTCWIYDAFPGLNLQVICELAIISIMNSTLLCYRKIWELNGYGLDVDRFLLDLFCHHFCTLAVKKTSIEETHDVIKWWYQAGFLNPTGQDSFMSQDGGICFNVILSAFKNKDISRDTQIHEVVSVLFLTRVHICTIEIVFGRDRYADTWLQALEGRAMEMWRRPWKVGAGRWLLKVCFSSTQVNFHCRFDMTNRYSLENGAKHINTVIF